jgi:outer membrane protein assembly factor BamA
MKHIDYYRFVTILLVLISFLPAPLSSQENSENKTDTICVQKELGDVIRVALNKPPKAEAEEAGSLLLLPIIGSNPATGFMIGVGGQYAFKVPGSTLYSALMGSVQFTTKNQQIFLLKNNIYTKNNKFFLSGDWRYLIYSQSTYGLGTNSPEGGVLDYQYSLAGAETSNDSLTQPMKFRFARLHQTVSFKLAKGFYAGLGYNYDGYTRIVDEKLRLNPGDTFLTSNYLHSKTYGFDPGSYYMSAVNVKLVYDTRDNMINAYKGIYATASWRSGLKILGNDSNVSYYEIEWRSFHSFSKSNPRHLLAFWLLGNFSATGDLPYLILPATSYDQRSRSGRGYTQGRFRGANMVYGEAEYRFPISRCGGILGGVLFVNATTADARDKSLALFESVKPGYGMGLRIMADKSSRTNLAVDVGFGQKSFGFYLAASESF